jgi:hypothetical protein
VRGNREGEGYGEDVAEEILDGGEGMEGSEWAHVSGCRSEVMMRASLGVGVGEDGGAGAIAGGARSSRGGVRSGAVHQGSLEKVERPMYGIFGSLRDCEGYHGTWLKGRNFDQRQILARDQQACAVGLGAPYLK